MPKPTHPSTRTPEHTVHKSAAGERRQNSHSNLDAHAVEYAELRDSKLSTRLSTPVDKLSSQPIEQTPEHAGRSTPFRKKPLSAHPSLWVQVPGLWIGAQSGGKQVDHPERVLWITVIGAQVKSRTRECYKPMTSGFSEIDG